MALDPVSKLRLALDVGARQRELAPRVVHSGMRVLAPGCVPLLLTDGLQDYATTLLPHGGHWVQPPRQRAHGPAPKPR
ncbi:MAG: hypothetical protein ACRERE_12195 [Candidatus Entotheonellia bacterium]